MVSKISASGKMYRAFYMEAYDAIEKRIDCGTEKEAMRVRFTLYNFRTKAYKEMMGDSDLIEALNEIELTLDGQTLIARRKSQSQGLQALAASVGMSMGDVTKPKGERPLVDQERQERVAEKTAVADAATALEIDQMMGRINKKVDKGEGSAIRIPSDKWYKQGDDNGTE